MAYHKSFMSTSVLGEKSKILKMFNAHFEAFIRSVAELSPQNEELQKCNGSFEVIRRANPTIIIKVWKSHIYTPYKDVIDRKDLAFIVEKDYAQDLTMFANVREIMDIIDRIREPIRAMDDAHKEATMKYIENLSKLSCLYSS